MTLILCALWAGSATAQASDLSGGEVIDNVMAHEQQLLDIVARESPDQHTKLLRLRDVRREEYVFALIRVAKAVQRAKSDPAFAERARAIREHEHLLQTLAEGFEALDKGEQRARRVDLERVAGELMDLKQAERRARLAELRQRMAEFELEIGDRDSDREGIIESYVDGLLTPPVEL